MNKTLKLAVVMDPITSIKPYKDSTFAMMLEAQARGYELHCVDEGDLSWVDEQVQATAKRVRLTDDPETYFEIQGAARINLCDMDVVLMRKDPPFDMQFIYYTYLLDHLQSRGVLVFNRPDSIRNWNEKFSITGFPELTAETQVSSDLEQLHAFLAKHKRIVIKPLDGMGGEGIFQVHEADPNKNALLEMATRNGQDIIMAQRFLPEYTQGDKRILIINGEAFEQGLARIPSAGESRANLAAGGTYEARPLTEREWFIVDTLKPHLKANGLMFVGIDVIGDYLTEINVTSPTCIRELDKLCNANIAGLLFDAIEAQLV